MLLQYSNTILQKKVFKLVKPPKKNKNNQQNEIEEEKEKEQDRFVQIKIHST
jgi:hypothetical protein